MALFNNEFTGGRKSKTTKQNIPWHSKSYGRTMGIDLSTKGGAANE